MSSNLVYTTNVCECGCSVDVAAYSTGYRAAPPLRPLGGPLGGTGTRL